jgi:MT-A70
VPVSMYRERKGKHSAKPDFYREMIERMTPGLPRIELFARTSREGWMTWGNQAKGSLPTEGCDSNAQAANRVSDALDIPAFLKPLLAAATPADGSKGG